MLRRIRRGLERAGREDLEGTLAATIERAAPEIWRKSGA
jgi:hypothetical protein